MRCVSRIGDTGDLLVVLLRGSTFNENVGAAVPSGDWLSKSEIGIAARDNTNAEHRVPTRSGPCRPESFTAPCSKGGMDQRRLKTALAWKATSVKSNGTAQQAQLMRVSRSNFVPMPLASRRSSTTRNVTNAIVTT